MIIQFADDIWVVRGRDVVAALGFIYPTRMIIIRLKEGGLFVWSPIQLTPELSAEIIKLGRVRFLVAPNSLHHLFIGDWKREFPHALSFAAPRLREKRRDLAFDGDLGDQPDPAWSDDIDQVLINSNAIAAEVVFFHRASQTVIFTDLLQQLPCEWFSGWRAIVAKWDLLLNNEPSVPRKFRVAFTNREAARASVRRILTWPAEKVLMAHGQPVEADGQAFLRRAFKWLIP